MATMRDFRNLPGYYGGRLPALFREIFFLKPARLGAMNYDEYWKAKGDMLFTGRCPVFAGLIARGSSVLDIGCGEGTTLKFLEKELAVKGSGLDISSEAVAMAVKKGISASRADVSSEDFRVREVYDYIIISEVLEHLPDPEALMEKVKGKFRKGLILSIPNTGHYIHRLRLLFGHFPVQWAYHPGEHLRFWTLADFKGWLKERGFEIVAMKTHSGFLLLYKVWPGLFADSFIFMVKEK